MFFVAETEKHKLVKEFYENAKKYSATPRFGVSALDFALQDKGDKYRIYSMAKPLITNTSLYLALFILIPSIIFGWGFAGVTVPAILVIIRIFETDYFGFQVLKYGLRKKGYTGLIQRVTYAQLVEETITDESERDL